MRSGGWFLYKMQQNVTNKKVSKRTKSLVCSAHICRSSEYIQPVESITAVPSLTSAQLSAIAIFYDDCCLFVCLF
jgi:hypothetical protein